MAALISRCQGFRKSGSARNKQATRLGDGSVYVAAATYHTFCRLDLNADGSGSLVITQDGEVIHRHSWQAEKGA